MKKNKNDQAKEVIGMFIVPECVEEVFKQKVYERKAETKKQELE